MDCDKKRRYLTKAEAKQRAKSLRRHGFAKNRAYRCALCGCWHLTTCDADSRAYHRRGERPGDVA